MHVASNETLSIQEI